MTSAAKREARDEVLNEVFDKMAGGKPHGGQAALADALNEKGFKVTKMAINQWKRVPDRYVQTIAELTDIPMSRLRKDLYGFLSRTKRPEVAVS